MSGRNILAILTLSGVLAVPCFARPSRAVSSNMTPSWPAGQEGYGQASQQNYSQAQGRLSPEDQRNFDTYYANWLDATRKNATSDIQRNARLMEDIMARYNIPANVPFDQVASNAAYPPNAAASNAYQGTYPGGQVRLTPQAQSQFNKAYSKWLDATRKGDQDDIRNNARKMQDIMATYNIPPSVPFSEVASGNPIPVYPPNASPNAASPAGQWHGRLSPQEQQDFDSSYKKWVDASRKGDQMNIDKHAREMQDIMARNNIPPNVPFNRIASGAFPGNATYSQAYPNNAYPGAYATGPTRLSATDQQKFDKYYRKWVDATNKNDQDDISSNARHMQDIMARYNIPANVPFSQIASPNATEAR